MAIGTPTTIGQAGSTASASSLQMTLTASVSVGDFIIVATGMFSARATHTITDSGGNTYTTVVTANQRTAIAWAKCATALTSGVSTITASFGGTDAGHMVSAFKVTGLDNAPFDASATGTNGGTTAAWSAGTTGTTAQADELVVGACSVDTATTATSTPGAGYSEVHDFDNTGAFQLTTIFKIVSATGTQTPAGTWTSSAWTWNAAAATFKAAAGGGTPATVGAVPAAAAGTAPVAAISAGVNVAAVVADATGAAPPANQLVSVVVGAPASVALGSAPAAAVSSGGTGATVSAVPASAGGTAPSASLSAGVNVTAAVAAAAGSGPVPAVSAGATITAAPARGDASAPRPGISPAPPGVGVTSVAATFAEDS